MICRPGMVAACVLIAAGAVSFAAEEEDRITRELAADATEEVDVLGLERPAVYVFSTAGVRLEVRVTPDGLIQFLQTSAPVGTKVVGTGDNRVSFELKPDQRVSVWPVATLTVRATDGGITVEAAAAGWAFVVRADDVGREGLSARCDGIPCRIRKKERIDSDRRNGNVVFRHVAGRAGYPGSIVGARPRKPPRQAEVADVTGQVTPGVFVDSARDFPWQSIALPVLSWDALLDLPWEVLRPRDVSP